MRPEVACFCLNLKKNGKGRFTIGFFNGKRSMFLNLQCVKGTFPRCYGVFFVFLRHMLFICFSFLFRLSSSPPLFSPLRFSSSPWSSVVSVVVASSFVLYCCRLFFSVLCLCFCCCCCVVAAASAVAAGVAAGRCRWSCCWWVLRVLSGCFGSMFLSAFFFLCLSEATAE